MIRGLTDKGAMFPELGTIRKGGPKTEKTKPGPDLDYFRFHTDDSEALAVFKVAFGEEPREIEIVLPFPTTDENFEAWREEYVASGLKHRCDSVTAVQWLRPDGRYSFEPIPCPGGCKQTARLKVVIPALERFAYVTVTTTSIWDIITIHQNLLALEMLRGSLRGIPMMLRRIQREISTPASDGKRARRKKWLITVEAKPEWVRLELAAQRQAALPSLTEPLMLALGQVEEGDDLEGQAEADLKPVPEMITDAQLAQLIEIVSGLESLGVSQEQWRQGISNLTGGKADDLAELTNAEAAKVINSFSARLNELSAEGERAAAV